MRSERRKSSVTDASVLRHESPGSHGFQQKEKIEKPSASRPFPRKQFGEDALVGRNGHKFYHATRSPRHGRPVTRPVHSPSIVKTSDTELLQAVHEFLRYQIIERHTGDPLDLKR